MLTDREKYVYEILNEYVTPALRAILRHDNSEQFDYWKGNCCRQTAFVCTYFLSAMLPEYEWAVWEGMFDDVLKGKPVSYEHAWVYGVNRETKRRLFVDMARIHTSVIFEECNGNHYPKIEEYKDLKEKYRTRLDWHSMVDENEFYTKEPGWKLIQRIKDLINWDGICVIYETGKAFGLK